MLYQNNFQLGYVKQLFILYVLHHGGITQMPRHHLFRKSGQRGATFLVWLKCQNIAKFSCFFSVDPKYIPRHLIGVNLYITCIHHNVITQMPHDHIFRKSRHRGATLV